MPPGIKTGEVIAVAAPSPIGRLMDVEFMLGLCKSDNKEAPHCRYCGKIMRYKKADFEELFRQNNLCTCDHPEEMYSQFGAEE